MKAFLRSRLTWLLLLAVLVPTLCGMARDALLRDPRFLAGPVELNLRPSDAVEGPVVRRLADRLRALGPVHLLDPHLDDRVRGALLADPVVEDVSAVERRWPHGYAADAVLRRPYAAVRTSGGFVPVTLDGIVLPAELYAERMEVLYAIEGVRSDPPPPGEYWMDLDLDVGLLTLHQIAPFLASIEALRLTTVDVSRADEPRAGVLLRGELEITVLWGRPAATVAENPVERKILFLRAFAEHVELLRGRVLDVRFGEPYLRPSTSP